MPASAFLVVPRAPLANDGANIDTIKGCEDLRNAQKKDIGGVIDPSGLDQRIADRR